MSGATDRNPRFDFDRIAELSKEAWRRRMAGFEGLVRKAIRGNPDPLIAYIDDDGTLLLSEDDRRSLAWLLHKKLSRIGRPPGSVSPKNAAIACACCLVRIGKSVWRRKHGRQRVPEAVTAPLIKRAIELMEAHFPETRGKISADAVGANSHLKPDSEPADYVAEYLDDAKREIIELASSLSLP
jgi:hypothetical protein